MFTTHFKLSAQPFVERMPVDRLLQDERMTQGLARLEYLATAGSIALVAGQTGVGKSSLLKLFLHTLSKNRYQPVYVHLTHVTPIGLLRLIVRDLGEVPKRGKENLFLQILEKTQKSELMTVIVIDEGHLTQPDALTDLRLLVSSALGDEQRLKLIITGQETLWSELKRSTHLDFVHRISVRYYLPPLTADQTAAYIDFQMRKAGASDKVFDGDAKQLIHDFAGGVPRQINNIATTCLINGAAKNLQKISTAIVEDTMREFQLP